MKVQIRIYSLAFARTATPAVRTFIHEVGEADDKEVGELAFGLDNHPDTSLPEFRLEGSERPYALSVGDVVEVRGSYVLCCGSGWKVMSSAEFLAHWREFVRQVQVSPVNVRGFWDALSMSL